jgi:hypothetical protein
VFTRFQRSVEKLRNELAACVVDGQLHLVLGIRYLESDRCLGIERVRVVLVKSERLRERRCPILAVLDTGGDIEVDRQEQEVIQVGGLFRLDDRSGGIVRLVDEVDVIARGYRCFVGNG